MVGATAALIMGGLAAAGSLGSAAISSSAAGKAADAQQAATGIASGDIKAGTQSGVDYLKQILEYQKSLQQPYMSAGSTALTRLDAGLAPGGEFSSGFDPSTVTADPGFAFRLQQGQQAVERSAAAKGGALGGGALKALTRYAQDYSSGEYGKAYDRSLNTWQTNRSAQLNPLMALAGMGQTATNATSNAAGSAGAGVAGLYSGEGSSLANLATQAGNARASGYVGSGNAWGQGLSGAGNGILQAYLASQIK